MKLPCLSMWQPYAELVVSRAKPIENRSWIIEREGVFLVHAAKKKDWPEYKKARRYARENCGIAYSDFPKFDEISYGGIVGATQVVSVIQPKEVDDGWHMSGLYGHKLDARTCRLPFRPLKGLQSFWFVEVSDQEIEALQVAGLLNG